MTCCRVQYQSTLKWHYHSLQVVTSDFERQNSLTFEARVVLHKPVLTFGTLVVVNFRLCELLKSQLILDLRLLLFIQSMISSVNSVMVRPESVIISAMNTSRLLFHLRTQWAYIRCWFLINKHSMARDFNTEVGLWTHIMKASRISSSKSWHQKPRPRGNINDKSKC